MTNAKLTASFPSVPRLFGLLALVASPNEAFAQKKGGGNTTSAGNVVAWYDNATNTLYAVGDAQANKFVVSLNDDIVYVSPYVSSGTTINGGTAFFSASVNPLGFSVVVDGAAGNDYVQVNVGTGLSLPDVSIQGGDGDDLINVHVSAPEDTIGFSVGNLEIIAGKGNDKVNVAMLFNEKSLYIAGDLGIEGGDGADEITIYDRVIVEGNSVLNGGAGRNGITLSAVLRDISLLSNFRTVILW